MSIVLLAYFYLELLSKDIKQGQSLSALNSSLAIQQRESDIQIYKKHSDIVFFIRAYNEEQTIATVIQEIIDVGYHDILIVNDGSKDNTKNIIMTLQQQYPGILLINHPINRGGGAANKTGFLFFKNYGTKI